MQIYYVCQRCGEIITIVDVEDVEHDSDMLFLTRKDLQDIINVDLTHNVMYVFSMCEQCIAYIGIDASQNERDKSLD